MIDQCGELVVLANTLGGDPEFARAGGGNVSVKIGDTLYIKPSGVSMATLAVDDLVPLRMDVLLDALDGDEPVSDIAERAAVRCGGRRPSVEILFHALIPDDFVVHTHPPLVNMVSCNEDAASLVARLLGEEALFVPYTDPGTPLAREVRRCRDEFVERTGNPAPGVTVLGNHGLIVSGATAAEVAEKSAWVMSAVSAAVPESLLSVPAAEGGDEELVSTLAPTLRGLLGYGGRLPVVVNDGSEFVRAATVSAAGLALVLGPTIPDQIVYAGARPLVVDGDDAVTALAEYRARFGRDPVVVVVPGAAVFAAGDSWRAARTALSMYTDALRVAVGADALGRFRPMSESETGFIEHWEAEEYRRQVDAGSRDGRLDGKVVVVTGAAQGLGLGVTEEFLDEGAHVVLADLNIELARQRARELCCRHGAGRAVAVRVDVSDEQSCMDAVAEVVSTYGGVDVFVSNAGVLLAGSVYEQPIADFDLVTAVNYRGYFLGVRAVAPVMARQHRAAPGVLFDIVEVNSKSGLEGSRRNFAYSGSKFGGIGLTQSFAMELIEDGIKVNAVCPGNFFEGPLWADPENGLFVQYLRTGKVPGAETVEDVRRFYESKVPMERGCTPVDLARAVVYLVEQQYEIGQALPVTGGQIMLS